MKALTVLFWASVVTVAVSFGMSIYIGLNTEPVKKVVKDPNSVPLPATSH